MLVTILVGILVIISLGLVVTIPVALATPGEWESSKTRINNFFQIWVFLIVMIATADGITSSL